MPKPKTGLSKDGKLMHYTVGAVIKQNDKYLLIDRATPPFGFAGVAGHIDENETEIEAVKREVKEESGFDVISYKLITKEEFPREKLCTKGANCHFWFLFACEVADNLERSIRETKSIGFYTTDEIKKLTLEPIWKYWFEKLEVI